MIKMEYTERNIKVAWLQISDLHVFLEADTNFMLEDYRKLAKKITPQFLIVTGDFRHLAYHTTFSSSCRYLQSLLQVFHISKKDVFFVPGNHDVNDYAGRNESIEEICQYAQEGDYNFYSKFPLDKGFEEYNQLVKEFYSDAEIKDERIINPGAVYCINWKNKLNILCINTSLISNKTKHQQIVDINALSRCKFDNSIPTIMIGHHAIEDLFPCYQERIKRVVDQFKICVYLHGDRHLYENTPITKISTPNQTIPSITCAKSAPQSGDSFSDVGVIYYEWASDDNTYLQAYRWTPKGFTRDPAYYYEIDRQFYFSMLTESAETQNDAETTYAFIKDTLSDYKTFINGHWVKEALRIWEATHHEGIGRCLLIFYIEREMKGYKNDVEQIKKLCAALKKYHMTEKKTVDIVRFVERKYGNTYWREL